MLCVRGMSPGGVGGSSPPPAPLGGRGPGIHTHPALCQPWRGYEKAPRHMARGLWRGLPYYDRATVHRGDGIGNLAPLDRLSVLRENSRSSRKPDRSRQNFDKRG